MADNSDEKLPRLVVVGWIVLLILYCVQVGLFVAILVIHKNNNDYIAWLTMFLPALALTIIFLRVNEKSYADKDKNIWFVWFIWGTYIVPYVTTVAYIFATVAKKLTKQHDLGVNALKMTLCITPGLLILFLQLAISPSYRKPVLSLSIFAALNIFDGIEMLETFLMQNEELLGLDTATDRVKQFWMQHGCYFNFSSANATKILKEFLKENKHFNLNCETEWCIIVFACICFLLSSFGLTRYKFEDNDVVKERTKTSIIFGFFEIIGTNLPFLGIRAYIWKEYKYEAAVFIAKNIVSLVVGAVEFGFLINIKLSS